MSSGAEVRSMTRQDGLDAPVSLPGPVPIRLSAGLTMYNGRQGHPRRRPGGQRWINVLAGGTKKPLELAKMAGVDMTKPDPIREAVAYVGKLVDEVVESF